MDTHLADRIKAHDVLPSLQEQMAQTGEKYAITVHSEGIAVSTETLTRMAGLLDWATTFDGSQQLQQPTLILSGPGEMTTSSQQWSLFSRSTHTTLSPHVYGDTQDRSLCLGRRLHPRWKKTQARTGA